MGFLDDVSAFGKGISQKTKDMVDVTSNNSKISGLQKQLDGAFAALGSRFYNNNVDNHDTEYEQELINVRNIIAEIERIKGENKAIEEAQAKAAQAAAEAKAAKQAAAEAKQAAEDAAFQAVLHPQYGQPQMAPQMQPQMAPQMQPQMAPQMQPQMAPQMQGACFCTNCGTSLPAGSTFCTTCGTKLG